MDFPICSGNAYIDTEEQGNAETDEERERSWQLCREERTLLFLQDTSLPAPSLVYQGQMLKLLKPVLFQLAIIQPVASASEKVNLSLCNDVAEERHIWFELLRKCVQAGNSSEINHPIGWLSTVLDRSFISWR